MSVPETAMMQGKIDRYGLQFPGKRVSSGGIVYIEDARVDLISFREIVEGLIDQIQKRRFPGRSGEPVWWV